MHHAPVQACRPLAYLEAKSLRVGFVKRFQTSIGVEVAVGTLQGTKWNVDVEAQWPAANGGCFDSGRAPGQRLAGAGCDRRRVLLCAALGICRTQFSRDLHQS